MMYFAKGVRLRKVIVTFDDPKTELNVLNPFLNSFAMGLRNTSCYI